VAADFPNGGGNRAFLFVVDAPGRRFSWFFQNLASAVDLDVPIVVGGKNYGAPIDNLKAAMEDAGLGSVDLWIASDKAGVQLVVPAQYMDKWRLDRSGIRPVPNAVVKKALGFKENR